MIILPLLSALCESTESRWNMYFGNESKPSNITNWDSEVIDFSNYAESNGHNYMIEECTFQNMRITPIEVKVPRSILIESSSFENCTTENKGGGIFSDKASKFVLDKVTACKCSAKESGHFIFFLSTTFKSYMTSICKCGKEDDSISSTTILVNNGDPGYIKCCNSTQNRAKHTSGIALHSSSSVSYKINYATISNNTQSKQTISLANGVFNFTSCNINSNKDSTLFSLSKVVMYIRKTSIYDNSGVTGSYSVFQSSQGTGDGLSNIYIKDVYIDSTSSSGQVDLSIIHTFNDLNALKPVVTCPPELPYTIPRKVERINNVYKK